MQTSDQEDILLKLKDGDLLTFKEDNYNSEGCESCDYGSSYVQNFTVVTTRRTGRYQLSQMYEYVISHDYLLKIILPNASKIQEMTCDEFFDWLETKFEEAKSLNVFRDAELLVMPSFRLGFEDT
jgi:hypothetical protein